MSETKHVFPNERMKRVKMSGGIREILSKAEQMEREGRSIIHMEIGRPDFDSPQCAKDRVVWALNNGQVHYTDMGGTQELREEISKKYCRENNMKVDPVKNVVVTAGGAMEALSATMLTLCNPGDEVIVPVPYFSAYADVLAICGLNIVPVEPREGSLEPSAKNIERAITQKTAAILINTPNNPSGTVFSKKCLEEIAEVAQRRDIWVVSDECYEKFLYDGEHISIASLPGMENRTVTVASASKTWSMTGWRVGWIIAPEQMRPFVNKCHQNLVTCANAFAQAGVAEAFRSADADVKEMVSEYRRRRDMVLNYIKNTDGLSLDIPQGAFYAFPLVDKIKDGTLTGFEFCEKLLEEAGVSAVPGDVFGMPGHIRLAYCREYEYIEEGMKRVKKFVESL